MSFIKTKSKKIISLILLTMFCLLCFLGAAPANELNCVQDDANVLSDNIETDLKNRINDFYKETKSFVIIKTTKDLTENDDIGEYSREVFNKWNINNNIKQNGILIVLSTNTRAFWFITGDNISVTLNAEILESLQNKYAIPYYSKEEYGEGTLALTKSIINELRVSKYKLEPIGEYKSVANNSVDSQLLKFISDNFHPYGPIILIIVIVGICGIKIYLNTKHDQRHGTHRTMDYLDTLQDKGIEMYKTAKEKQKNNTNKDDDDASISDGSGGKF